MEQTIEKKKNTDNEISKINIESWANVGKKILLLHVVEEVFQNQSRPGIYDRDEKIISSMRNFDKFEAKKHGIYYYNTFASNIFFSSKSNIGNLDKSFLGYEENLVLSKKVDIMGRFVYSKLNFTFYDCDNIFDLNHTLYCAHELIRFGRLIVHFEGKRKIMQLIKKIEKKAVIEAEKAEQKNKKTWQNKKYI